MLRKEGFKKKQLNSSQPQDMFIQYSALVHRFISVKLLGLEYIDVLNVLKYKASLPD